MRTFGWRSALQPAFVAASVTWAVLLLVAPFIASRPHPSDAGTSLVVAVYGIGTLLCHQLPQRSYRVWSVQMPVCARCAGIYAGAAMASVLAAGARGFQPSGDRPPERLALQWSALQRLPLHELAVRWRVLREPRVALLVAVAPTLATLVYEWTTGVMPAHVIRAAAGVPIGAVAAWLVVRFSKPSQARDGCSASPGRVGG